MDSNNSLLSTITGLDQLRTLSYKQLNKLANEIRAEIIKTVAQNGGHLASNLGVVELTIALHRVYNSPDDRIIWDVGHQCYAHKLLTGRVDSFQTLRQMGGIAGFPKTNENPLDTFNTGHASTSISAALGLISADSILRNETPHQKTEQRYNEPSAHTIAVIGDGALTGGLAYEALSNGGQMKLPLTIILNDNQMSIDKTVGGVSLYLSTLTARNFYQNLKKSTELLFNRIPYIGPKITEAASRIKRAVKAIVFIHRNNFFIDMGYEYVGPVDGHDIQKVERVLLDVKKMQHPVIVHVVTQKGRGLSVAEEKPDSFHAVAGNGNGKNQKKEDYGTLGMFTDAFSGKICSLAKNNPLIAGITAAMEKGVGLHNFSKLYPKRFFDVGIAEEHAVTFAAGLAKGGLKPVAAIYSTFIQRSIDQIIHDVVLQNLPVVFAMDRSGFVGGDGETHQGLYDIALLRSIPGMEILAPATREEFELMLDYCFSPAREKGPIAIRYPKAACPEKPGMLVEPLQQGRGAFYQKADDKSGSGANTVLMFTGSLLPQAEEAARILAEKGIAIDLYNLRFLKPLDEAYFTKIASEYKQVVIAEEGCRNGGFGEYAKSLLGPETISITAKEDQPLLGTREELLTLHGLDGAGIAKVINNN
ncbi:MAG: 1-deoxy-D-xylulose-5-phosphate synthase [Spirochaetaceae bacterium]|jgi:1-deoxy-D-xylulose-5-phosphate synthase|nr:1-deoxy-D-xylulose-5-phosphate synthase [Spirochaetaceae bacterium]